MQGWSICATRRWPDLARLLAAFDVTDGEGALTKFRLHVHAFRNRHRVGDIARAQEHLDAMLEINRDYLRPRDLVALAEGMFLVLGDDEQAKRLLAGLPEPEVQMSLSFPEETLRTLEPLLYKSRLDYLLGDRRSPMDIIPESCDPKGEGRNPPNPFEKSSLHRWVTSGLRHGSGKNMMLQASNLSLSRFFDCIADR